MRDYWTSVTEIAERQRNKGLETYGRRIEEDTMSITERIRYIEEELVDALFYLEHLLEEEEKREDDGR